MCSKLMLRKVADLALEAHSTDGDELMGHGLMLLLRAGDLPRFVKVRLLSIGAAALESAEGLLKMLAPKVGA